MNKRLKLGIFLFMLGFLGVLSTLTMEVPLPEEIQEMVFEVLTPMQFKLLSLVNPTILLTIGVVLGTVLYDKVQLRLPLIENVLFKNKTGIKNTLFSHGILGGILAGILITGISAAFMPSLPNSFVEMGEKFNPNILVRFLYGGFTEEIMMRFGLMTVIAWICFKIAGKLSAAVYWISILIAALLFALGHLPMAITLAGELTPLLLLYIIIGNAVGGIIFGWLYWKQGLESAMIAHIFAHVVMVLAAALIN